MDDLTPNQRKALKWLVERALAGDIDGEEFYFGWDRNGFLVSGYPTEKTPRDIKENTIDRLHMNGYLYYTRVSPSLFRAYIEDVAYVGVDKSNMIKEEGVSRPIAPAPSAKRVFVSYASEDKALVDALIFSKPALESAQTMFLHSR